MTCDYRLKKEKDFNLIFNKGKRLYSTNLTVIYLPSKSIKAGFAVSKKHGGSVQRNRIKRLLRESFRSFIPQIGQNFFFVFIPKVCEDYSLNKFKIDMEYLLLKGGFINKFYYFCRRKSMSAGNGTPTTAYYRHKKLRL